MASKEEEKNPFQKLDPQTKKYVIIGGIIAFVILIIVALNMEDKSKDRIEKEKARIEIIIDKVNTAIQDKDFDKAETIVLKVKWELKETNTSGYSDDYDERRIELQKLIEQKKSEN